MSFFQILVAPQQKKNGVVDIYTMRDVIIIGAGIGGLCVHSKLLKLGHRPLVLEARMRPGGRVRTVYSENKQVLYESGPWRVSREHRRMRSLCREHGVQLVPISSPMPTDRSVHHKKTALNGLSQYDVNLLGSTDPVEADLRDQATGYADNTFCESSTTPYHTASSDFLVAPDGFDELIRRMTVGVEIRYNTRVVDVDVLRNGRYLVSTIVRDGDTFKRKTWCAHAVFICLPPYIAKAWPSFAMHNRIHLSRVDHKELQHIYCKGPLPRMHTIDVRQPLVQTISDSYGRGWFQASYTGGRVARFWYHLRLAYPKRFLHLLETTLYRLFRTRITDVRPHFWHCAYHIWKPVPRFHLQEAVSTSVRPNPVAMPRVFWAGEAYSSYQGWMEGALETAILSVDQFKSKDMTFPLRGPAKDEIVVEQRVLGHLLEWSAVHPGGTRAIQNHLGEEASSLFKHIGHSDHACAILAAHQVAWADSGRCSHLFKQL